MSIGETFVNSAEVGEVGLCELEGERTHDEEVAAFSQLTAASDARSSKSIAEGVLP